MESIVQRKKIRRILVEKKEGFDVEAKNLYHELKNILGIKGLSNVRIINRYDVTDITDDEYKASRHIIFSEPPVDLLYEESVVLANDEKAFAIEYLPGQFDQRADSASQCIQIQTIGERPRCKAAKLIVLKGDISKNDFIKAKSYCINPVDSREALIEKPDSLDFKAEYPKDVSILDGFSGMNDNELLSFHNRLGLAMSIEDLKYCREYFANREQREPTITEIRMIDTYWSDHCRHTTFHTNIQSVKFEDGPYSELMRSLYEQYKNSRVFVYDSKDGSKSICLMDLATIAMKELRKRGKLSDLDISDEINACSIVIEANINGEKEEWLLMFKNETHNHPTEIEPFGGASTCLGGAIRDPLSGRAYVYQAMRITGSGDPRTDVKYTIDGKLPQRKITTDAAMGYSSYGNQIGLTTGQVAEIYDEGYVAKRMELGAVIGAAPKKDVIRKRPEPGDSIILLGGRTGRDGCGGATGSSKEHDEQSLFTCGAEVQKGNPPTERMIQRLFRKSEVSRMIKKCNDFGAGGVSVAIGELADSLDIDLDKIPTKYEGLDGTELAISESQERMAIVVDSKDEERFIKAAGEENLEATAVAAVTSTGRLRMKWRGQTIVNVARDFLDTNGVKQYTDVIVKSPSAKQKETGLQNKLDEAWLLNIQDINNCSQKGLIERFDSTIGAGTILMPLGGKYQLSLSEGMAAKLPVLEGDTSTCTLMTFGYNPKISRWSPFHGAVYAIVEAAAKIAAMGGDYKKIRLTLQEYFEKLGKDPIKWGKPFSALLGAYYAQMKLDIPAIGGKDSMSGTFKDLDVPPTLVAFAVAVTDAGQALSTEFKKIGSNIVLLELDSDYNDLPDFDQLDKNFARVHEMAKSGKILSAQSVRHGGIAAAISNMCFGNKVGADLKGFDNEEEWFVPKYGSLLLEIDSNINIEEAFCGLKYKIIGQTTDIKRISISKAKSRNKVNTGTNEGAVHDGINEGTIMNLDTVIEKWMQPLESIFPTKAGSTSGKIETFGINTINHTGSKIKGDCSNTAHHIESFAKPRVLIPVFPGTNCEFDTAKAFNEAGGYTDIFVIKNLTPECIRDTINVMQRKISQSQILMLPGGLSAGSEPDGSGKFVAALFRNPYIADAVMDLLKNRDGLILGIGDGFQALIKLGLVPYGEIRDITNNNPALTLNTIGRHVSCMVNTRIASNKSPWFSNAAVGDIHTVAISHREGRFVAAQSEIERLAANGQIATQYVDMSGNATYDIRFNPNGSMYAIEGITSPDGRVLGKMGHSERKGAFVCNNVPGNKDQKLFEAGIKYFK